MDVLVAIDRLDDMVHNARPVPLTDQVRIDAERIRAAVDALVASLPPDIDAIPGFDAHHRLAELVRNAKPVPMTDQLRLDKDELYDLLDQLRAKVPEVLAGGRDVLPPRARALLAAVDELDELVHGSRRWLSTRYADLPRDRAHAALDEVHRAAPPELRPIDTDDVLEDLDHLIRNARSVRGGERLRVETEPLFTALDRLRVLVGQLARER